MEQLGGSGLQRGVVVSTFLPCWIKSIDSGHEHLAKTMTFFSTLAQAKSQSNKRQNTYRGQRKVGGAQSAW